jgi:hypothetical protein
LKIEIKICTFLTLFSIAYFVVAPTGGGGGIPPPYGKSTWEWLSPILFYTVTYTYIDSLNPRGQVLIFKCFENLKIKNLRYGFGGQLVPRVAKNKRRYLERSSFLDIH